MPDHRLDDFIWNCRRIIEDKGSTDYMPEIGVAAIGWQLNPNGARAFKDTVVSIVCEAEPSPAMLVTKLGERGNNPVICVNLKGECYRQHAEFHSIADHVAKLGRLALVLRLHRMSPEAGGHGIISMDHLLALGEVVDAAKKLSLSVDYEPLDQALDNFNNTPLVE